MPFKSRKQQRACYAQRARDIKAGRPVKWDCDEFARDTDFKSLPLYKRNDQKLLLGPRGGMYYVSESGRKVYVKTA